MSQVIGGVGDFVTPVATLLANGLGTPKFVVPISTQGIGGKIARYVRVMGRHHKITGGVAGSTVTIRARCNYTGATQADAGPAGNNLHIKQAYNTADGNTVDVCLGSALEAQKVITNATNATPIVVTSAAHGYNTGDKVEIAAVAGNTNANGTWDITVVDANTFSLNGSSGNAAYTSGGTSDRHIYFAVIAHMNAHNANAGGTVPIPSLFVDLRVSNASTAWSSGGTVYIDRLEILD